MDDRAGEPLLLYPKGTQIRGTKVSPTIIHLTKS